MCWCPIIKLAYSCLWIVGVPREPHFHSYSSRLGSTKGIDGLVAPSLAACASLFEPAVSCAGLEGLTRLQCVCRCMRHLCCWVRGRLSAASLTAPRYSLSHGMIAILQSARQRQPLELCVITFPTSPLPSPRPHLPSLHQVRDLTRLSLLPTHVLEAAVALQASRT